MIAKLEETGSFDLKLGSEKKPVSTAAVEDVKTALQEQKNSNAAMKNYPNAWYADQYCA